MALPFKSVLGNWLGLTRETTTFKGQAFFSRRGFIGPYLYLAATEPSANSTAAIVDIEGLTTVTALATGTAAVSPRGIAQVTSAASSLYTMTAPPGIGVRKVFFTTSTSTVVRQITSSSPIVGGAAVGGSEGTLTGSTSFTVLTFNGIGQFIELTAVSTAAWVCSGLRGFSTAATPLTS